MTQAEELYHKIAAGIPCTKESKMFGALCIKAENGKAGVMFWNEFLIVKLSGDDEKKALDLTGAKIFDPMGGRPMGGWVQLSYEHKDLWAEYAFKAMEQVKLIITEKKKKK